MFGQNTEIGRNESWIFYKNSLTVSASKYAVDKWKLKNIAAVYVEEINPVPEMVSDLLGTEKYVAERAYLLINHKRNQIIKDFTSYESLLYWIDFMGLDKLYKQK